MVILPLQNGGRKLRRWHTFWTSAKTSVDKGNGVFWTSVTEKERTHVDKLLV